jgi:hypothetical protein
MSKEYNGGKAGFWIGLAIREGIPAIIALVTGIAGIFRAGRKIEAQKVETTTQTVEPVPTQEATS